MDQKARNASISSVLRTIERFAKKNGLSLAEDASRISPNVVRAQLQSMYDDIWKGNGNGSENERTG